MLEIGDRDLGALFGHVPGHCDTRDTETDDQNLLTFKFAHFDFSDPYLSFNVESVISASRTEMIQKRTMTLGSAQPLSSK